MLKKLNQKTNRWVTISKLIGVILLGVCTLFVAIQFRSVWQGPRIQTDYPVIGMTLHDPILTISGTAYNIAQLYIYGVPTPIQLKTNRFVAEVALPVGSTYVTLDGYTRSGRHTRATIPLRYEPPAPGQPLSPGIELLQKLQPTETPFRATSDLLEQIEQTPQ